MVSHSGTIWYFGRDGHGEAVTRVRAEEEEKGLLTQAGRMLFATRAW